MLARRSHSKEEKKEQDRIESLSFTERKLEYQQVAREAWDRAWQILHMETGWKDAGGTSEETTGKVSYQNFPDIGRVFKLKGIIPLDQQTLFQEVVAKVEENPTWNPTVLESRIVETIDDDMDICHNITAEAAGGLVASRDFISVRHWKTRDGVILSAGVGVLHPDIPPTKKYVRGHQKPGGWAFKKLSTNQTWFTWVVASELNGWIPQAAIEAVIPSILVDFMAKLKLYVVAIRKRQGKS